MSLKTFNWLKDGLLPLSLAIMTVCWLSPWVSWVGSWGLFGPGQPLLSPLAMAAILIASTFLTKALLKQDLPLERTQAIIPGAGLLIILAFIRLEHYGAYALYDPRWLGELFWALSDIFRSFPPQLVGLLLGAYLWWRGIGLGRESIEFDGVFGAFRFGIVMLIALLVLSITSINDGEVFGAIQREAIPAVLTFFFFSLLSLSLSRLEQVREEAMRRDGKALSINRDWLISVIVSVLAIVFLGFVFSSIFSFDLAARILGLLLRLVDVVVMYPLFFVVLALGFAAEYLIYFFRFLLSLLGQGAKIERPETPEGLFDEGKLRKGAEASIPPEVIQVVEWLIVAAIIALVVYLFVRALMRLRRAQVEEDVEEVRESLWSWQAFVEEVKAWLRAFWSRLAGRRKPQAKGLTADRFHLDPEYKVSLSIRQVYQSLLSHAARLGSPKRLDETPYEYVKVLEGVVPSGREDLLAITEAYVRVRYSGEPAQAREFTAVDAAWARLRQGFRDVEEEEKRVKGERGKRN